MNRAVSLLTVASFAAMLAGFVREAVVAFQFGATGSADALALTMFYVDGATALAVTGISGVLMVPVIARTTQAHGQQESFRLMDACLLWAALILVPICLALSIGAEGVAVRLAPHFRAERLVTLAHLLFYAPPTVVLVIMSGIMGGVLQAHRDYFNPVHGRTVFALGTAATLLLLPSAGVAAAGPGMLLGGVLLTAVHIRGLRQLGWTWERPSFAHAGLTHALQTAVPTLSALVLINLAMGGIQRMAASSVSDGGLAAMNYALRALNLVSSLTMSLATVSLTEMSHRYEAEGMSSSTLAILTDALDTGVWLLVPLSLLLVLVSEPLIGLLFLRGRYDLNALLLTAQCLRWLAGAVVPGMIVAVLMRAAPAFGRPWRSTVIAAVWTVATVVGTIVLLPAQGAAALASGHTIGVTLAAAFSMAALSDLVPIRVYRSMLSEAVRMGGASLIGFLAARAVVPLIWSEPSYGQLENASRLLVTTLIFALVTGGVALLIGDRRTAAIGSTVRRHWSSLLL